MAIVALGVVGAFARGRSEHADDELHPMTEDVFPDVNALGLGTGENLAVVASNSIIGDVVANIGGEDIELEILVGADLDPHSYEPTPMDFVAIEKAHVVFINGFGLEESLLEPINNVARGVVVPVSHGIDPIIYGKESVDPHVWFDPTEVIIWVSNITQVFSAADPENRESYHANATKYLERLEVLDQTIRGEVASIPVVKRKLVSDHRFFAYFAREYGFELLGQITPSESTTTEPSAKQIALLVEMLRRENISTLFVGETAGRGINRIVQSIADELGQEIRVVELLTGSLTKPGTPGDTYLGYMEHNIENIVSNLR